MHNTMADVRTRLEAQHEHIRGLMSAVRTAGTTGTEPRDAFDRLRTYLAVHEAAEEARLHAFGQAAAGDSSVVEARVREESEAEKSMQHLESLELGTPEFEAEFADFERKVMAHAEAEERDELPQLESMLSPEQVDDLLVALRRVSAVAELGDWSGTFSDRLRRARDDLSVDHPRDSASSILPKAP